MVDLAEAGRRLAEWEVGQATDPGLLRNRARRRTHRRRVARIGGAAVTLAAAVIATILFIPGGGTTQVRVVPALPTPFPAVPLPPAPPGWTRTAIGAVDLATPPRSMEASGPLGSSFTICVTGNACPLTIPLERAEPVRVSPFTGRPAGNEEVINGLAAYVTMRGQLTTYDVPSLQVSVEALGDLGRRIASTMAPSPALVVASATSAPSVPADWRTVGFDGVTLSVPPDWPVVRLHGLPTQQPPPGTHIQMTCSLFLQSELYLGDPPGSCNGGTGSAIGNPSGLWLGQYFTNLSDLTQTRLLWVAGADVELGWNRLNLSYLSELTIHTHHGVIHATVGIGSDPTTIEEILSSIRDS